jgi:hypothetical protein
MLDSERSREADGVSSPVRVALFRCPRARRHCVVLLRRAGGHRRRVSLAAVRVHVVVVRVDRWLYTRWAMVTVVVPVDGPSQPVLRT